MKLSDIKSIKVGKFEYKVFLKKKISHDYFAEIHYGTLQIRLQRYSYYNKKLKKEFMLSCLVHEIVHAIDENVKFTKDKKSKENNTDLLALYVVDNIEKLVNKSLDFNHFKEHIVKCEMDINQKEMTFEAIVKMLSDNKKLVKILMEAFK